MVFRRKEIFVTCLLCLVAIALTGCVGLAGRIVEESLPSEPTQKAEVKQKTAAPATAAPKETEQSDAAAKKAEFNERIELIGVYSASSYETATTQMDLNRESGVVYAKWDALLNDIYLYLKQTMSPEDFAVLEVDEAAWVQHKEKAIETAAEGWKGGSGEPMARNSAGIVETQKRCYYLLSLIQ